MVKDLDHASLEYSTFRVPYEEMNRKYRNGHKNIEKAVAKINKAGFTLRQRLDGSKEQISIDLLRKSYNNLRQHVDEAQKAFNEASENGLEQTNKFLHKIDMLEQDESVDPDDDPLTDTKHNRIRAVRYSIDYLLLCGHLETAKQMAKAYGLEKIVDHEVYEEWKTVENALRARNTKPCLSWIENHRAKLKRNDSLLEFVIRKQDIVDLVLAGKSLEAMDYYKKYLTPIAKTIPPFDVQQIWTIIGLGTCIIKANNLYAEYFNDDRWEKCVRTFQIEMFRTYQLSTQCAFTICLQAGISAHKTPSCRCDPRPPKEVDCYVCNRTVWPIADGLPNAHVTVSRILCSMTGEPCNETNIPYLLPSGHVYGQAAIDQLKKGEFVACPETGSLIPIQDIQRLYFL